MSVDVSAVAPDDAVAAGAGDVAAAVVQDLSKSHRSHYHNY